MLLTASYCFSEPRPCLTALFDTVHLQVLPCIARAVSSSIMVDAPSGTARSLLAEGHSEQMRRDGRSWLCDVRGSKLYV
jgi:hypothetical protein